MINVIHFGCAVLARAAGIPSINNSTVDHSMICKLGGFITQRHNELRDLEAELETGKHPDSKTNRA